MPVSTGPERWAGQRSQQPGPRTEGGTSPGPRPPAGPVWVQLQGAPGPRPRCPSSRPRPKAGASTHQAASEDSARRKAIVFQTSRSSPLCSPRDRASLGVQDPHGPASPQPRSRPACPDSAVAVNLLLRHRKPCPRDSSLWSPGG